MLPLNWLFFDQESPYEMVWRWQQDLVEQRIRDEMPDTVLLGQHAPVITKGRGTHNTNILPQKISENSVSIPIISVERGGDVTYHGPGQVIGYPILKLGPEARDLHAYLRNLEAVLMAVIQTYGLSPYRAEGKTGVWVEGKKVASMGVAVKHWVTYHGFALNVYTELQGFSSIRPCGLDSEQMCSLDTWIPVEKLSIEHLKNRIQVEFERYLGCSSGSVETDMSHN